MNWKQSKLLRRSLRRNYQREKTPPRGRGFTITGIAQLRFSPYLDPQSDLRSPWYETGDTQV